ncbi:hypothetical protein D3C84_527620 [compost metagenome]
MVGFTQGFGTTLGGIASVDPARAHCIDTNFRAKADGQGMGQGQQPALARRISFGIGFGLAGPGRSQVDDGPAMGAQIRRTVLGQQHGAAEVDRQHTIPVGEVEAFQCGVVRIGYRRIAHQRIEPTKLAQHLRYTADNLLFVGHIHADEPGVFPERLGHSRATWAVQVGEHHLPALADQPGSDAKADTPCRAGHQRNTSVMVLAARGPIDHKAASPRARSACRSATSSRPTATRIRLSRIPAAARS